MPLHLWLYVATLVLVLLLPGPDMLLVLQTAARHGRSHALSAATGLAIARIAHVTLAGAGLAALLQAAPALFTAFRLVGAAYIVWLGIQILRAEALHASDDPSIAGEPLSHATALRRGLLTNILNPKALIFCSILLPQFVDPAGWPLAWQFALLGAICVGLGFAYDAMLSLGGDQLGRFLRGRPLAQRIQKWLFGSLLIAFGARLALSRS